jgi:MoaA/NifB/PqqE/SkfB family radical SAM enzyme
MSENKKDSYTAANSLPMKIFHDKKLLESIIDNKKILPRHIQISPTNYCNLKCPFCSCDERDKQDQLDIKDLFKINDLAHKVKTTAYTITGGGEPLLHPHINEFITDAHNKDISIGLVSNGILTYKLSPESIKKLTWARVSFADFRDFDQKFMDRMDYVRSNGDKVDLAFSYVVSANPKIDNIIKVVEYGNKNNFTHIRLVPDLYDVKNINMTELEEKVSDKVDTSLCIFQNRETYTKGSKDCEISLLKPMIASDGYIYPCCGVQYALPNQNDHRKFPKQMRMGHWNELENIIEKQEVFNGEICSKCYYDNYNKILNNLKKEMKHKEFL